MYNMFSCSGFGTELLGGCSMAWLGLVLLFFVTAIVRKWGGEEMGVDFNFPAGVIAGCLVYFVLISLVGSFKWAFVAGLVAMLIGGYLLGQFFGGSEDDEG